MGQPPHSSLAEARLDLAYSDDLTGLFSRRLLGLLFEHLWASFLAQHGTLAVIVIDLDRFKEVNDTYGHRVGDHVLCETAAVLRSHFRGDDILVRYGGDEFVIVLPGVGEAEAGKLAGRARAALAEHPFAAASEGMPMAVPVSFSLGVSAYPDDGERGQALLDVADRRLLEDKRSRRARDPRTGGLPLGSRLIVTAVAALAVVLIGAGLWLLGPLGSAPQGGPVPVVVKGADPAREAALLAQIKVLQDQLAAVTAERARATDADSREGSQHRIDELTRTIAELQQRIGTSSGSIESAQGAATPSVAPPTPAAPAEPTTPAVLLGPAQASPTPDLAVSSPRVETPAAAAAADEKEPVLLHYERPIYPEAARKLRKEASIELRVTVDVSGRVTEAERVGPPVGFGFEQAARMAAFRAVYRPGTRDGVPAKMATTLVIQFKLSGNL